MKVPPTLDRHIATGGAYTEFSSQESMREHNGLPATPLTIPRRALDLVLADYFGPERTALLGSETRSSSDPKLRVQQLVLRRYFDM
jgi:hypothetical protein